MIGEPTHEIAVHPASFRDPSGFIFRSGGRLLRSVSPSYGELYRELTTGGLYDRLVERGLLIPHRELRDAERAELDSAVGQPEYILEPEVVPTLSYPWEWCFGQLKAAALATLAIQKEAVAHGLTLKDASAFNVQFVQGGPVFIDTLSFDRFEDRPWVAYGQFCRHFLAPLALMSYVDVGLSQQLRAHLDGIPLPLAAQVLGRRGRLRPALFLHLFLHARAVRTAGAAKEGAPRKVSETQHLGLVDSLERGVRGLTLADEKTVWTDYYEAGESYEQKALEEKEAIANRFLDAMAPKSLLDLGANTGMFTNLAVERGIHAVACDADHAVVQALYNRWGSEVDSGNGGADVVPLWIDLSNPTSGCGWAGRERSSFAERAGSDAIFAFALVHHLAIANNVPLPRVAEYLAELGRHAAVEFVPKSDPQVQRMLRHREDIFEGYTQEGFEAALRPHFTDLTAHELPGSDRVIYTGTVRAD